MRVNDIINEDAYNVFGDPLYVTHKQQISFAIEKYVTTRSAIYKGGRNYGNNRLIMRDPNSFENDRRSANTLNYYTLWMDSSPQWKGYPKRGRSMICSNSKNYASSFGDVAVAVPLMDCTIGVCPADDLWNSFYDYTTEVELDTINRFIKEILYASKKRISDKTATGQELRTALASIELRDHPHFAMDDTGLYMRAIKMGGVDKLLDHIFDPKNNHFATTTWNGYNLAKGSHEVWFSAPCIMVPIGLWTKLVNS